MKHLRVLIAFVLCYISVPLEAQDMGMVHYTVNDGLPGSNVYCVFKDRKGYIWVCTDKGIARFNGYGFKTYTTLNGLPYNDVWGIQEDSRGRLWLQSYSSHFAYFSYTDEKIHSIRNNTSYSKSLIVRNYQEKPDGSIVAITGNYIDFMISDTGVTAFDKYKLRLKQDPKTAIICPQFKGPYIIWYPGDTTNTLSARVYRYNDNPEIINIPYAGTVNYRFLLYNEEHLFFISDSFFYRYDMKKRIIEKKVDRSKI